MHDLIHNQPPLDTPLPPDISRQGAYLEADIDRGAAVTSSARLEGGRAGQRRGVVWGTAIPGTTTEDATLSTEQEAPVQSTDLSSGSTVPTSEADLTDTAPSSDGALSGGHEAGQAETEGTNGNVSLHLGSVAKRDMVVKEGTDGKDNTGDTETRQIRKAEDGGSQDRAPEEPDQPPEPQSGGAGGDSGGRKPPEGAGGVDEGEPEDGGSEDSGSPAATSEVPQPVPYKSLLERAKEAGVWSPESIPEELEEQTPPLGDVLSRLESSLTRINDHNPAEDPPLKHPLRDAAVESARVVSTIIDYGAQHPDNPEAVELIKAAKNMALAAHNQDMPEALERLQELQEAIADSEPGLLWTLTRPFKDVFSWRAADPMNTQEVTQQLRNFLGDEPALFIPLARGGLMAGFEVSASYMQGNGDSGSEVHPVRISFHKEGDLVPKVTESELAYLQELAADRHVVILDDDTVQYIGDTLTRAGDYLSEALGKEVVIAASADFGGTRWPSIRKWDHNKLADPNVPLHFGDIEACAASEEVAADPIQRKAADDFRGHLQLFLGRRGRQLNKYSYDASEWSVPHTTKDSSETDMHMSVGTRRMSGKNTPFVDVTVKEQVPVSVSDMPVSQTGVKETTVSFVDFNWLLFARRSVTVTDHVGNVVSEEKGRYVKCGKQALETVRRALYRKTPGQETSRRREQQIRPMTGP